MTQSTRNQTAIAWALAGLIVTAPHLLGGTFCWTTLILAIAATVLAGTAAWAWGASQQSVAADPLAIALGLLLCLTALHAVPLPLSIAELIASDAVDHAEATHALLAMPAPTSVPMTLDPGRTHERLLYGVAVWCVFCIAMLVSERRRSLVLGAVALSGVLIALSDLAHLAVSAKSVYGLYHPAYMVARGPLLNPNNLAGMLALSTPVCLGLAARADETRIYWLAGAVITGASCLVANSRGGTASLVAGVVLFAGLLWLRGGPSAAQTRRRKEKGSTRRLRTALVPLVALITSFVVVHFAASTPLDTSYSNLSKLDMLGQEVRFVAEGGLRAVLGFGRGALPAVFSGARFPLGRVMHAENSLLQYAIDYGAPVALLLAAYIAVRLFRGLLRWRSVTQLGGVCGCVAIGLQSFADFGLELTGIAIPAAACLAAALSRGSEAEAAGATAEPARARSAGTLTWLSAAAGTIVVTFAAAPALRNDAYAMQLELQRRAQSASSDFFWPLYRTTLLSHPADPALTMLGAARKTRDLDADAWPWIERTMALAPQWGAPRVLAAHWLLHRRQQNRAVQALAQAAERDPVLAVRTLCDWLSRTPRAEVVFMVLPAKNPQRHHVLNDAAVCLSAEPTEADKVDGVLLAEDASHLRANVRTLRRAHRRGEYATVADKARALQQLYPGEADPYMLEAAALAALKQPDRAAQVLVDGVARVERRIPLLLALITFSARSGNERAMRDVIPQIRVASSGDPKTMAQALAKLASAENSLGNYAHALSAARDAYELDPLPNTLGLVAAAAEQLGQSAYALDAWDRACREAPTNKSFCGAHQALAKRLRAERDQGVP
jgi:tetratricopeptide (TPR) repeat protein